jgi:hypothetical protein
LTSLFSIGGKYQVLQAYRQERYGSPVRFRASAHETCSCMAPKWRTGPRFLMAAVLSLMRTRLGHWAHWHIAFSLDNSSANLAIVVLQIIIQ